MWSLETLAQINQAHAETGDARKAYEKCGIRVCGDCPVKGKCPASAPAPEQADDDDIKKAEAA